MEKWKNGIHKLNSTHGILKREWLTYVYIIDQASCI